MRPSHRSVLTSLAAAGLALAALAAPRPAAGLALGSSFICGNADHTYTFGGQISLQQGSTAFATGAQVKAKWNKAGKIAYEDITIDYAGGTGVPKTYLKAQRTCSSDPWITKASCSAAKVTSASGPYKDLVKLGTTGLAPFGLVPAPLTPQQLPQPLITSPKPNDAYLVASVPFSAKVSLPPTPYCTYLTVVFTQGNYSPQQDHSIEGSEVKYTFPFDQLPPGQWVVNAQVRHYTGDGSISGPLSWPIPFTVGQAGTPLLTDAMLKIQSPGHGTTINAQGGFLSVLVQKPLYEAASPKQVALAWEQYNGIWNPAWPGSNPWGLPTQLGLAGSQEWVPASAVLDFAFAGSSGLWRVTACVKAAPNEWLCQKAEFTVSPPVKPFVLQVPGGGASGPVAAVPVPPPPQSRSGAPGGSSSRSPGPAQAVPPSPAAPPAEPRAALRREPLRLTSTQPRGDTLVVVLRNPGEVDAGDQPVELRLGRAVVGRGQLGRLAAGQEQQLVVPLALPRGTRGPVDVEVWVGGHRVGIARVAPASRAR